MMAFKKYCVDNGRATAVNSSFVMGLPFGSELRNSHCQPIGNPTHQITPHAIHQSSTEAL